MPSKRLSFKGKGTLYLGLLKNIFIGLAVAAFVYFVIRMGAHYFINNHYLSPENQSKRREGYIAALQQYAASNELSSKDAVKLAAWAREHPYVYLLIYKDDELFFTSDMQPETPEDEDAGNTEDTGNADDTGNTEDTDTGTENENGGEQDGSESENPDGTENSDGAESEGGSSDETDKSDKDNGQGGIDFGDLGFGGFEEYKQNREELIAEAEANGLYPIELADGTLIAALTEFTQELYFDIANATAFAMAALSLTLVLLVYMSQVIAKIKKLEADVTVVSHTDMNHAIVCEGNDELSRLSSNVETMRNSILDKVRREREAREANTELVTSISHDIRTPLTVLLGYIDMMKARAADDEVMSGYISASESTAIRLKRLSDDMFKYALTFGEIEQGIKLEEYDASTLTAQLLDEHILLLSEDGYDVRITPQYGTAFTEGDVIVTDAQNLMRIVDNIFSNLYKYADKSAPIEMTTEREDGCVTFTCKNRILKNPDGAESNGIGLKSCARLGSLITQGFDAKSVGDDFVVSLKLELKRNKM